MQGAGVDTADIREALIWVTVSPPQAAAAWVTRGLAGSSMGGQGVFSCSFGARREISTTRSTAFCIQYIYVIKRGACQCICVIKRAWHRNLLTLGAQAVLGGNREQIQGGLQPLWCNWDRCLPWKENIRSSFPAARNHVSLTSKKTQPVRYQSCKNHVSSWRGGVFFVVLFRSVLVSGSIQEKINDISNISCSTSAAFFI